MHVHLNVSTAILRTSSPVNVYGTVQKSLTYRKSRLDLDQKVSQQIWLTWNIIS